ncbi:vacuolar fusion protein CCZ1 isoform X2 [Tachypleus tridentatus]
MAMTVNVPTQQRTRDGQVYIEYLADDVQDHVYKSVLKTSYLMFRLFNGTFQRILSKSENVEMLKEKLLAFYKKYLPVLKLSQADLLDVYQGIHFLPLDKYAFLKVQCFVNLLEANFSHIKYTAFLYNDQLVWSGLEQDNMQVLYMYLTLSLIPSFLETEIQGGSVMPSSKVGLGSHYGRFMTGFSSQNETVNLSTVPTLFLTTPDSVEDFHLLIYRALSATVCMLVECNHQLSQEFFRRLDSFLGPALTTLASDISEQYSKLATSTTTDTQLRFIYFNHMNLAQKSSIHPDGRKSTSLPVPSDIMKLLADINCDLSKINDSGEIIMKTMSEWWVVGKMSDQREFYVVLNQKSANLIEINEEVKRLCASHFQNIFFLD